MTNKGKCFFAYKIAAWYPHNFSIFLTWYFPWLLLLKLHFNIPHSITDTTVLNNLSVINSMLLVSKLFVEIIVVLNMNVYSFTTPQQLFLPPKYFILVLYTGVYYYVIGTLRAFYLFSKMRFATKYRCFLLTPLCEFVNLIGLLQLPNS